MSDAAKPGAHCYYEIGLLTTSFAALPWELCQKLIGPRMNRLMNRQVNGAVAISKQNQKIGCSLLI